MREIDDQNLARMIGYSTWQFVCSSYQAKCIPRSYYFTIDAKDEAIEHDLDDSPVAKVKTFIADPEFLKDMDWFCQENEKIDKFFKMDDESVFLTED